MSVPVMIALLARIQDQLMEDAITSNLASDLARIIAALLELREEARQVMLEAEGEYQSRPGRKVIGKKRLC